MNRGLTPDELGGLLEERHRVTIVVAEDDFPYRGFEARGIARLLDRPYGPEVRRIATRYVGADAAAFYDDERGGTVVRIEPTDSRGWDFRDDLEAMGVFSGDV